MSLNRMILCSKLKNDLGHRIVTKSQVVTKFNVTKSRLHCLQKETNQINYSKCTLNSCVYHLFSARVFKVINRYVGSKEYYSLQ